MKKLAGLLLLVAISTASAVEPNDVIVNEVYFNPRKGGKKDFQAVELLVVKDSLNLNGLQVSNRTLWNVPKNDQCTLQDMGRGFLSAVPAGTLIVIYNGQGTDDTDGADFTLSFYAQSSLFCNIAPTTNAFRFPKAGNCLHLLHLNDQVDFVKYRASDATHYAPADPGKLNWQYGVKGHVDIGKTGENVGFRFIANKPDLNDFPAAWLPHSEDYKTLSNLGKPNGGLNTLWVNALREKGLAKQ